jgi:hypothetical protein
MVISHKVPIVTNKRIDEGNSVRILDLIEIAVFWRLAKTSNPDRVEG